MNTNWKTTFGHTVTAAEIVAVTTRRISRIVTFLTEQWDEMYGSDATAEKPSAAEFTAWAEQIAREA